MRRRLIAITTTMMILVMLFVVPAENLSFAIVAGPITDTGVSSVDRTGTEEFTGIAHADNISKYGNVMLNIKCTDFLNAGYEYGDVLNLSFLDQELEVPFCNDFSDVGNGETAVLARDSEEYITIAIYMGDFATNYGLAVKNIASDKSVTWTPAEGVIFPVEFRISMNNPGGYYQEYIVHQLRYTNERDDYPYLSDEQFANFRVVTTTGMGKDRLYRSASPINPQYNRNTYADAAIRDAGVTVIMNLADDETEAVTYEGYEESYYSKQKYIALNMLPDFAQDDFKEKLAKGLRFFINNPGVYEVHCTEGKDRAGVVCALLEWLMGAGYDEVLADYMVSFYNYYGIEKGDERYDTIVSNFETSLNKILKISDLKEKDLQVVVAEYMMSIGLSENEITALKKNLGADRNTLDTDHRDEWVNGQWYDKKGKAGYRPQGAWKENIRGCWYEDSSGWYARNQWQKIDSKWYYFDKEGYMLKNTWKRVNENWYYFKADGHMALNEFIQGWWVSGTGAWKDPVRYRWHKSGSKWWYGTKDGWYAKSKSYTIDGKKYTFDKKGYTY
ncbi:MAG: SAM-dependent chlorinase/fluorinase [Eubacterium sp.]|nr:SAM-dependent chlorinase/fluorinase [Eubacterium sp.]